MTGCQYGAITSSGLRPPTVLRETALIHHFPRERQFRQRACAAGKNNVGIAAFDEGHQALGETLRAELLHNVGVRRARPDDAGDADGVPAGFARTPR